MLVLLEQRAVQRIGLPQVLELHDIQLTVSFFGNVTPHSSGRPSFSKDKDPLIQENTVGVVIGNGVSIYPLQKMASSLPELSSSISRKW